MTPNVLGAKSDDTIAHDMTSLSSYTGHYELNILKVINHVREYHYR